MLEIQHIHKQYHTGTLVQNALDDVSLSFRQNEFVAILGQSGSGKTTLLNIIGGLDRYDQGDLIINGISTKKFKDKDWDGYRNRSIGFIFQSYHLIAHQSVLQNVQLALKISENPHLDLAKTALKNVGLQQHMHKKPNQLSGGQMQRVAIARALVNDPDIVLADEPTGALDSTTSIQVMELLKEIAKDRLVIMVTHNPELAKQYATRIIELKDGKIISDDHPVSQKEIQASHPVNHMKSKMGRLTALQLSFHNLLTKKARTLLVAFAGSIGIIGIALILALSTGVKAYINQTERSTLSQYPITLEQNSFDYSSLIQMSFGQNANQDDTKVHEMQVIDRITQQVHQNDLAAIKQYIQQHQNQWDQVTSAIEYFNGIHPYVYRIDGEIKKIYPYTNDIPTSNQQSQMILKNLLQNNYFHVLPKATSLYQQQYTLVNGQWPKAKDEAVLILDQNSSIPDVLLYQLQFKTLIESSASKSWDFQDFTTLQFQIFTGSHLFTYQKDTQTYLDQSDQLDYVASLKNQGAIFHIVGFARPTDKNLSILEPGIYFTDDLKQDLIQQAKQSDIVQKQLADPTLNILTNQPFKDQDTPAFDPQSIQQAFFQRIFSSQQIQDTFLNTLSITPFHFDLPSLLDQIEIQWNIPKITEYAQQLFQNYLTYSSKDPKTNWQALPTAYQQYLLDEQTQQQISKMLQTYIQQAIASLDTETIQNIQQQILTTYAQYRIQHPAISDEQQAIQEFLNDPTIQEQFTSQIIQTLNQAFQHLSFQQEDLQNIQQLLYQNYVQYANDNQLPDPSLISSSFQQFMQLDTTKQNMQAAFFTFFNAEQVQQQLRDQFAIVQQQISQQIMKMLQTSMLNLTNQLEQAFQIDPSQLQFASSFNFNQENQTYESVLEQLGYVDETKPDQIRIYPKDFGSKEIIKQYIDDYNQTVDEDHMIVYTDLVGTMMSSITNIINVISYVLVAFVAISLLVSSIMIGVITYISVLERRKEIGILRALGASKKNISSVFNAETLITGFLAGLLGITFSLLLLIPINYVIQDVLHYPNIHAYLALPHQLLLIFLSMILTRFGGLIPSKKAARQDPVEALRSE